LCRPTNNGNQCNEAEELDENTTNNKSTNSPASAVEKERIVVHEGKEDGV